MAIKEEKEIAKSGTPLKFCNSSGAFASSNGY
jgi:hypothetical protein